MAIGIGDVYVNVLPNMEGFAEEVAAQVSDATSSATEGASAAAADTADEAAQSIGDRLKESFGTIGNIAGILFAGAFVKKSLDAYEEVEKAQNTLEFGLNQIGQTSEMGDLVNWAKDFSLETGMAEGTILGMMSKLTSLGTAFFESVGPDAEKYIEQLTEALTNMSVQTGKSAAGLMRSLAPSILNTPDRAVKTLLRMGALTQDQADAVNDLIAADDKLGATQLILTDIQDKYNGAAANAATPMDIIHNDMNQLAINVGEMLNPALAKLSDVLLSIPIPLQTAAFAAIGLGKAITSLVSAFGWENIVNATKATLGWIASTVTATATAIAATVADYGYAGALQLVAMFMWEGVKAAAAWIVANLAIVAIAAVVAVAIAAVVMGMKSEAETGKEVKKVIDESVVSLQKYGNATQEFVALNKKMAEEQANNGFWHMVSEGAATAFLHSKTSAERIADGMSDVIDKVHEHSEFMAHDLSRLAGLSQESGDSLANFFSDAGGPAAWTATSDQLDDLVAQLAGSNKMGDASKMTIAELAGSYVAATGSLDGLNTALLHDKISAGDAEGAIKLLQKAVDATGKVVRTVGSDLEDLSTVTGQSADALESGLAAAFASLPDDGGAALGKFVQDTQAQISDWAHGIADATAQTIDAFADTVDTMAESGIRSAADAAGAFEDLQKDSKLTADNIIQDAQHYAQDMAKAQTAYSKITKRAGHDAAGTLQYLSDHGITSLKGLDAVVGMSDRQWKKFQGAVHKAAKSAVQDSQNIADQAHSQAQQLGKAHQLYTRIAKKAGDDASAVFDYMSQNGMSSIEDLQGVVKMSGKDFDKFTNSADKSKRATEGIADVIDNSATQSLTDLITNTAEAQQAIDILGESNVEIPISSPGMDLTIQQADHLLQTITALQGADAGGADGDPTTPKAAGGPVSRGDQYLVGEKGPELFTPDRNGYIIPNHQLRDDVSSVARSSHDGGSRKTRTPVKLVLEDGTGLNAMLEEIVHDTVGGR